MGTTVTATGLGASYYLGASATAGAALAVLPVLVVADAIYVQVKNGKNRNLIIDKFERRLLDIPSRRGLHRIGIQPQRYSDRKPAHRAVSDWCQPRNGAA